MIKWAVENATNIGLLFVMAFFVLYAVAFLITRLTWWTDTDNKFVKKAGEMLLHLLSFLPFLHKK